MRATLFFPFFLLATTGMAHADVIEIADDGEARILGAPAVSATRFAQVAGVIADAAVNDPFEHAARRHGIDVGLLRALAWTESRGRNDAVSPKGARGIMQLMPATAAELGVDPRDPVANINGGAAYLARQLATFRDVPLALAAYNAGPGAVIRYRGVPPYAETRDYVDKIMRRWSGSGGLAAANAQPASTKAAVASDAAAIPLRPKLPPILLIEVPSP